MKIISTKHKNWNRTYFKLYENKVSSFGSLGRFERFNSDPEWVFFPRYECYNLIYLQEIINHCKNLENKEMLE